MNASIRAAALEDADAIARIYREALGYEYVTGDAVRARLAAMDARGGYLHLVAQLDGEVVGAVSARRGLALEVEGEYMEVLGLAVDARARRRGVGRALMAGVEAAARDMSIAYIALTSSFERAGAHAFYERLGYVRTSYKFAKGAKH